MVDGMTRVETIVLGERTLSRRDRVMAGLVRKAGPCTLARRRQRSHFDALVRAIVYQQLAGRAAAAIHARFTALFDGAPLSPQGVLALSEDRLRSAGLSGAKTASIRDLAARSLDGTVPLRGLARLEDDEIVERLSSVRGIGRWTAEMFLMFQLGRPDVWPVGDLGVRNGYRIAYQLAEVPTAKQLFPLGEAYRPFRSVAAWYCWQAVHLARGAVVTPGG
jgi:DNA-3-methyladenine glycosylase II